MKKYTVGRLIEELKKFDENLIVVTFCEDGRDTKLAMKEIELYFDKDAYSSSYSGRYKTYGQGNKKKYLFI